MSDIELRFSTAVELGRRIRTRELSPVALTSAFLNEIARVDTFLHAFIEVTAETAMDEAHRAEREIADGQYRGPLHGIPYTLKDMLHAQGVRTTAGARVAPHRPSDNDATVVARLRAAGAVLLGKTNLHEFAFGPLSTNPHYGDVRNPWDRRCHSGGSSGGSAVAVAAGLCAFSLGTDTTGSIRIPAAFCGVFGLKPTYGRVSRSGVIPLAWSLDHVGPLCRTAEDAGLVLSIIAGADPNDRTAAARQVPDYVAELDAHVAGLRIAVLAELAQPTEPEVERAFGAALARLATMGVAIDEITLPDVARSAGIASAVLFPEALSYHERNFRARPQDYAEDVRQRLALAELVSGSDYVTGQRARALLSNQVSAALKRYDIIACPTEPIVAPRRDQSTVALGGELLPKASVVTRCTRLFNLTGHPAASVPCGFSSEGLPIGLQLVAGHWRESTLLRVAHAYQRTTKWHQCVPDLADMHSIPDSEAR